MNNQEMINSRTDPNDVIVLHKEIAEDMRRIISNLQKHSYVDESGSYRSRCEQMMFQLSTRPKTLQKRRGNSEAINKYKQKLREKLSEHKDALDLIKDKGMLLYVIAYLIEDNYNSYDVDNIPKHFCDVLKEFTSTDKEGDNKIKIIIVEKRLVTEKPPEANSIEECEEFLVYIAHEMYKNYLFD